jgi:hypothetical protein
MIPSNALAAFADCAAASLAFFSCESFDRALRRARGCDDDRGERDRRNEHALSFGLHHGPLNPYA